MTLSKPSLNTLSTAAPVKISVYSAGAARSGMTSLAEAFFKETGYEVNLTFAPVGAIVKRLADGEMADIVVLTDRALEELDRQRKVVSDTVIEIGKVGVGIAVQDGMPSPDISTSEAFRQTILAAKSLVYADPAKGASSGIHFASILKKMGITDEVKKKSICLTGGYEIMKLVAEGKAELGIQQISEIIPVKGVRLVGPLPSGLQKITTYAAGVMKAASVPDIAASFISLTATPAATHGFITAGFGKY